MLVFGDETLLLTDRGGFKDAKNQQDDKEVEEE